MDRFTTLDTSFYAEQGKLREGMSGPELNRSFQQKYYAVAGSYNTALQIGLNRLTEDQLWRLLNDINDTIDTLKQVPARDLSFGEVKYDVIGGFQTLGSMKAVVAAEIRARNRPFFGVAESMIDLSYQTLN